jgi:ABC-type spermidine/putrescine transport system permease subunit II
MRGAYRAVLPTFFVLILGFLYMPIVMVVVNSFNGDATLSRWGGFTLSWWQDVLADQRIRTDFLTSVKIAFLSMVLSLVIAVTAGLWSRRASLRRRQALDATTYLRLVLPEIVVALGLFILARRINFPLGIAAVVVGHVVFNSAYATIIIQARLATLSADLEDAAADLGATPRRIFMRVTMPLLAPAIVVAALLTFTFSFDNVISSLFLSGSHVEPLPVLLFGLARFHVTATLNAIGAGVMAFTTLFLALCVLILAVQRGTRGTMARVGGSRE